MKKHEEVIQVHPERHNYHSKVAEFARQYPAGTTVKVTIVHDVWCAIFKNGKSYCNCDPDVREGEP